jgi:flavin-dependent dehydrogenase
MKLTIELDGGWFDYTLDDNGAIACGTGLTLQESMEAALEAYDSLKEQQPARKPRKTN